jgi:hypothetical protein
MEQEQPMEVDYENVMNDSDSIASSVSIEDDAMDGDDENLTVDSDDEMTGILYPQQLTLTIHLVQEADDSWTRTVE